MISTLEKDVVQLFYINCFICIAIFFWWSVESIKHNSFKDFPCNSKVISQQQFGIYFGLSLTLFTPLLLSYFNQDYLEFEVITIVKGVNDISVIKTFIYFSFVAAVFMFMGKRIGFIKTALHFIFLSPILIILLYLLPLLLSQVMIFLIPLWGYILVQSQNMNGTLRDYDHRSFIPYHYLNLYLIIPLVIYGWLMQFLSHFLFDGIADTIAICWAGYYFFNSLLPKSQVILLSLLSQPAQSDSMSFKKIIGHIRTTKARLISYYKIT